VFDPGKPSQLSLMFVGKARAYRSETPQVLHSRVGSWPYSQTLYCNLRIFVVS